MTLLKKIDFSAKQCFIVFVSVMMVLTGTINTLLAK